MSDKYTYIISNADMLKKFIEKCNDNTHASIIVCTTKSAQNLLSTALLSMSHNELIKSNDFILPSKTTIHNAYIKKNVSKKNFILEYNIDVKNKDKDYYDNIFDELWTNLSNLHLPKSNILTKIEEFRFITNNIVTILKDCMVYFINNKEAIEYNGVALTEIIEFLNESYKKSTTEIETGYYFDQKNNKWCRPIESNKCCVRSIVKKGLFSKICQFNNQLDYENNTESESRYKEDVDKFSNSTELLDQLKKVFDIEKSD